MMDMGLGLPSITIAFKSTSITAVERSTRGIVAMILKESDANVAGKRVAEVTKQFVSGDTVLFEGITLTATTDTTDAAHFAIGASLADTATNIVAAMTANSAVNALYTTGANLAVITITEKTAGGGNTPGVITTTGTGILTQESLVTSYSFGNPTTVYSTTDIPDSLSADNKEQIELALEGYQTSPKHILVYIQDSSVTDYNDMLLELEHARWDYLVIPDIKTGEATTIATWIKGLRSVKDKMVKAVLPNCQADNEGVVNFTNSKIVTAAKTYTTAEYCSRIAGMICGTPMTISCTFAPLSEVIDCDKYTKDQMDTKIGNGELFIMYDGVKFKIARGVNSFVTTIEGKNDSFKKIKLIDCMDMIHDDIKDTANDSYIGKYANSYDNKCLLLSAIQGYYNTLETEGLLDPGKNSVNLDLTAQKNYLLSNGDYTAAELAEMKDQVAKEANTRDQVFLTSNLKILDAIEAITMNSYI
jgi:hypothetical protein